MADSIREKIMQNIKTTLLTISVANGYVNEISSVQRWAQAGNNLADVPCIIINAGPETLQQKPGLVAECRLSVMIDLWIRHDTTANPGSTDAILNSIFADIEKALMVDYTRGGYAVNTYVTNVVPFETAKGQPYAGLIIETEILYMHFVSDPATQ